MSELAFESMDFDEIKKEADRVTKNNQNYLDNYVKMPEGNGFVVVRFLPKVKGKGLWCSTRIHSINGKNFHCMRSLTTDGHKTSWRSEASIGDCPICVAYNNLWEQIKKTDGGSEKSKLEAKARAIKPVERYYWNVIVRSEIDPKTQEVRKNVGPKILSIGKTLHGMVLESIKGNEMMGKEPLGDITDPRKGRDFKIMKKVVKGGGGAEYPNYDQSLFMEPSPAGTTEDLKTWLTSIHDLQALRKLASRDEMQVEVSKYLNPSSIVETMQNSSPSSSAKPVSKQPAAPKKAVEEDLDSSSDMDGELSGLVDDDFLSNFKNI
jgi:hypothetical protein